MNAVCSGFSLSNIDIYRQHWVRCGPSFFHEICTQLSQINPGNTLAATSLYVGKKKEQQMKHQWIGLGQLRWPVCDQTPELGQLRWPICNETPTPLLFPLFPLSRGQNYCRSESKVKTSNLKGERTNLIKHRNLFPKNSQEEQTLSSEKAKTISFILLPQAVKA